MKIHSLLGFAQRADKIISGEQGVKTALRRRKVHCLIISKDSSKNTQDRYIRMAENNNVTWYLYGTKSELGQMLGKSQRAVVAVTESGFANAIKTFMKATKDY